MLNEKGFKNFVLKSGLVCRIHGRKAETTQFLGVYIPSSILLAVVIYVHKHFNHPSQTQTHKEFCSLYYHPFFKMAKWHVKTGFLPPCERRVWKFEIDSRTTNLRCR